MSRVESRKRTILDLYDFEPADERVGLTITEEESEYEEHKTPDVIDNGNGRLVLRRVVYQGGVETAEFEREVMPDSSEDGNSVSSEHTVPYETPESETRYGRAPIRYPSTTRRRLKMVTVSGVKSVTGKR